jgi:hypothetical protein
MIKGYAAREFDNPRAKGIFGQHHHLPGETGPLDMPQIIVTGYLLGELFQ